MATTELHSLSQPTTADVPEDRPLLPYPHKRFTRTEYDRICLTGVFEGQRVELVEGEILRMSPIGSHHNVVVDLADERMKQIFPRGYRVRVQSSFVVPIETELEPDIAVVLGNARDYLTRNPDAAVLIIEVAESSREYDMTAKASLYARGDVQDYWVIDLTQPAIHVFRSPGPQTDSPFQYGYRDVRTYRPEEIVSPLAMPESGILVSDLLP